MFYGEADHLTFREWGEALCLPSETEVFLCKIIMQIISF